MLVFVLLFLAESWTESLFFLAFRRVKNEGYQNLGLFFYGKSFLQIPLFKVQTFFIRGNSPVNLVRSKHTHTWPILAEFFFLSVSKVRKQQSYSRFSRKYWKLSLESTYICNLTKYGYCRKYKNILRLLFGVQSNLAIRNFLVALKLFLNAKSSLSLWSKWHISHSKWSFDTNVFLIKPFIIAKFDCISSS